MASGGFTATAAPLSFPGLDFGTVLLSASDREGALTMACARRQVRPPMTERRHSGIPR